MLRGFLRFFLEILIFILQIKVSEVTIDSMIYLRLEIQVFPTGANNIFKVLVSHLRRRKM